MGQQYLTEYSLLLLFVSLSVVVPIGMLATAKLGTKFGVTPSRVTKIKKSAYEGGHPAFSEKPSLFSFGYFYYALLFVAFDVETILISLTPELFRCVTCGTDLRQHVNGKISYIPHINSAKDIKLEVNTDG